MSVIKYKSWNDFNDRFLREYHDQAETRRRQLVFRGQGDSGWGLKASLDRLKQFAENPDRRDCLDALIAEFRKQARIITPTLDPISTEAWELLGRHHGLPTSVLDFTRSPYIATWFAMESVPPNCPRFASIWMLDRELFDESGLPQVVLLDDEDSIRFNPRAHSQQGLFLRVKDISKGLPERLLVKALTRHDIPAMERSKILGMLEDMTITARTMYNDLSSAARAASSRILEISGGV